MPLLLAACVGGAHGASGSPTPEPIAATASNGSVRITLSLEGQPRNDALSWADVVIENTAARGVRWAGGGCGDPGGVFIDLREVLDPGRADWPGRLGTFKRLAIGNDRRSAETLNVGYVPESRVGTDRLCTADLRIETLPVGGSLRYRAAWDGLFEGQSVPVGPATVLATFPVIGLEGLVAPDETDATGFRAEVRTAIVGSAAGSGLTPGRLVDLTLADPAFAAFVQATPEATWINPDIALIDGIWHVGLFRTINGVDQYGGVFIDQGGRVVGHRFE